mgnify:CR=1 FL=1
MLIILAGRSSILIALYHASLARCASLKGKESRRTIVKRIFCLVALAFSLCASRGNAADINGSFYIGGGIGMTSCSVAATELEKARLAGIGTMEWAQRSSPYLGFIVGWATAYNEYVPDTCSIIGDKKMHEIFLWLENKCKAEPFFKFGSVVSLLPEVLHEGRRVQCPAK